MRDFAQLSHRAQVGRVRKALVDLLRLHGHTGRVRLVAHAYNTTFRVQTEEFDAAVRVNVNSNRSYDEVQGELAFVASVAATGLVTVPRPVAMFGGKPTTTADIEGLIPGRPVSAYAWISGRRAKTSQGRRLGVAMGQVMAGLHEATLPLDRLPAGSRPRIQNPIDSLPIRWPHEDVFNEAYARACEAMARQASRPQRLMHYDLHYGNVKWSSEGLAVFDFDDSLWSWPAADAAQSLFYLRSPQEGADLEAGFWQGFGRSLDDLEVSSEDFEAMVAGRALLLLTDLLGNVTRELAELAPKYLVVTRRRLEHYLRTGRFDPQVASLKDV